MRRTIAQNLLTLAVVFLTLSLVVYPKDAFEASVHGMKIFWDIVFPSLLPFFVLSEIMLGMGVVHFIGVLFEPLMRPLFSVPGEGAFALSMGLAAGYPMDAVITGKFRRANLCTRVEGERLLAFTNTADPLFMFGAVAVGMFGMPWLGATLAIAHYLSSFAVGLVFKLHGAGVPGTAEVKTGKGNILMRALEAMYRARREDNRSFGKLMGDAVSDSVKTLLMIGGFIMTFSVLIKVITVAGWAPLISLPLQALFGLLGIDQSLVSAALQGIFEIDLGAVAASQASAPFAQKVMIASAIIAWSGLSVHGQVASVLTGTDIRMGPYFVARLIHAVMAAVITAAIIGPVQDVSAVIGLSSSPMVPDPADPAAGGLSAIPALSAMSMAITALPPFWELLHQSAVRALMVPLGLIGFALAAMAARVIRVAWFYASK